MKAHYDEAMARLWSEASVRQTRRYGWAYHVRIGATVRECIDFERRARREIAAIRELR